MAPGNGTMLFGPALAHLRLQNSHLRHYSSLVPPHSSDLTRHSSDPTLQTCDLAPLSSLLAPQTQEPQTMPTNCMSFQGSKKPRVSPSCPQEPPEEGSGAPVEPLGAPRRPLEAPKSAWRHKTDSMRMPQTSCFLALSLSLTFSLSVCQLKRAYGWLVGQKGQI